LNGHCRFGKKGQALWVGVSCSSESWLGIDKIFEIETYLQPVGPSFRRHYRKGRVDGHRGISLSGAISSFPSAANPEAIPSAFKPANRFHSEARYRRASNQAGFRETAFSVLKRSLKTAGSGAFQKGRPADNDRAREFSRHSKIGQSRRRSRPKAASLKTMEGIFASALTTA